MKDRMRHSSQQASLLAMQMDALYKSPPATAMSIFGGVLALMTYWSPALEIMLSIWFGCISVIAIMHLISVTLRPEFAPDSRWKANWPPSIWARLIRMIYLGSGISWGIGSAWLLQHGNENQAVVIICLAMGAVTVTFPTVVYRPAFNLFQIPIFLALSAALAMSDLEYGYVLAVASAMLCIALTVIAQFMGDQLIFAFRLLEENHRLTDFMAERGMHLEEANRELTAQTLTDPLTGLANRRCLMEFMRASSGRCAVLAIDIDHFKSYNDTYGHGDGDICLVMVADALRRSVQETTDLAARQGGEEFVIVLTDLSRQRALDVAEKVRANIQALQATYPQKMRRLVTASIGVAYRKDDRHKSDTDMLNEADTALYAAKNAGRNQVVTLSSGHPAAA